MSNSKKPSFNRRDMLLSAGALAAVASVSGRSGKLLAEEEKTSAETRYLFVVCAGGGASIVDSFLGQASGPAAYSDMVKAPGSELTSFPARKNTISGFVDMGNKYDQATFLTKHGKDALVMTAEVSSVNHFIAARRALNGDNINAGRTLAEAASMHFGSKLLLPNLLMAGDGFAVPGDDLTVPDRFRGTRIADPLMFAFANHGFKGVNKAVGEKEMSAMRALRKKFEGAGEFGQSFKKSGMLSAYSQNRDNIVESLEKGDLITKMTLLDPNTNKLAEYGLQVSPDINAVREKFPNLAKDTFESQCALAFLSMKNGLSNCATIAPSPMPLIENKSTANAPIAFDWSHSDHPGAQNTMWSYVLKNLDGLIDLLKATDIDGDPAKGKMWSKSLIYIATEFGRDRVTTGGSGHHLNNGVAIISPLMKGNKVYGGIDPATALTFGFDPATGVPNPKTVMKEKHIYSAVAHALGLPFDGRIDFPSMVRTA